MMNDSGEGQFILNRFYTDSIIKRQLKEDWDTNYYPTHIPFVFSTIATTNSTKNRGSLPMWKLYGNDFKGALIRFNCKAIQDFASENSYIFTPCQYMTVANANKLIADFNKRNAGFDELMQASCRTKQIYWNYENEWRIIAFTSKENVKIKATPRGLVEYIELKVPISLVEEICLGPLTSKESLQSLELLKENLLVAHPGQINFKISQSTLSYK